jgi:hypothetical protein
LARLGHKRVLPTVRFRDLRLSSAGAPKLLHLGMSPEVMDFVNSQAL